MMSFLAHLVVTAAFLLFVGKVVGGVEVEGWKPALIGALVLGLANAILRPLMVLLTLPLTIVTFGLFLLVINALVLWMVAGLVPGFRVKGFAPALLGSLVLTMLNLAVEWLTHGGW